MKWEGVTLSKKASLNAAAVGAISAESPWKDLALPSRMARRVYNQACVSKMRVKGGLTSVVEKDSNVALLLLDDLRYARCFTLRARAIVSLESRRFEFRNAPSN